MNHPWPIEARAVLLTSPRDDELYRLLSRLKEADGVRQKGNGLGFRLDAHASLLERYSKARVMAPA